MKWFYELLYGHFRAPWDLGPRAELVGAVESGRIQPCRAIDLGSGTASNAIFLAQHGFDVTGVDFAQAARRAAGATGVQQIYRDAENPNAITVMMEWDSAEKARKFVQDPALAEVMKNAGVTGAPEIRFLNRA